MKQLISICVLLAAVAAHAGLFSSSQGPTVVVTNAYDFNSNQFAVSDGTNVVIKSNPAITNLSAANLTAGTTLPALNGASVTNLGAANIAAGGTFPALNAIALTNLSCTNLVGTFAVARSPGVTTNLNLLMQDSTTNTLCFTNGILMRVVAP